MVLLPCEAAASFAMASNPPGDWRLAPGLAHPAHARLACPTQHRAARHHRIAAHGALGAARGLGAAAAPGGHPGLAPARRRLSRAGDGHVRQTGRASPPSLAQSDKATTRATSGQVPDSASGTEYREA